jgi:hypothetical protein
MKSLISIFTFVVAMSSAQATLNCVAVPANNPNGLPVSWWITLDSKFETANVEYSGGPRGGVQAGELIQRSIPTGGFNDGFSVEDFGFTFDGRETHIGLGFVTESYQEYKTGEIIISVERTGRLRGMTELERAPVYCKSIK